MVTREEAIQRLSEERDYEDDLARRLADFFIISLPNIPDLTQQERRDLKAGLSIIKDDSLVHRMLFSNMMEIVIRERFDNF